MGIRLQVFNLGNDFAELEFQFGDAVNIAARIEGLADGGEIYFSEAVYLMMNKSEVPFQKLGLRSLKGIQDPVMIYRVPRLTEVGTYKLAQAADSAGDQTDPTAAVMPFGGLALKKVQTRVTGQGISLDGSFHVTGALSEIHYAAGSLAGAFIQGRWWRRPLGAGLYGLRFAQGGLRMLLSPRTRQGLLARLREALRKFGSSASYRRRMLTLGLLLGLACTAGFLAWRQGQMADRAAEQTQALADLQAQQRSTAAAAKARQARTQKALDKEKQRFHLW